jgi:hypothetical protein
MKSRITIEVDFDNGQPYIKVVNDTASDDVRDKLVSFFRQRLGYTSSWCKINFPFHSNTGIINFRIDPIRPDELKEQADIMTAQAKLNDERIETPATSH